MKRYEVTLWVDYEEGFNPVDPLDWDWSRMVREKGLANSAIVVGGSEMTEIVKTQVFL